jgi:hypothetical protein
VLGRNGCGFWCLMGPRSFEGTQQSEAPCAELELGGPRVLPPLGRLEDSDFSQPAPCRLDARTTRLAGLWSAWQRISAGCGVRLMHGIGKHLRHSARSTRGSSARTWSYHAVRHCLGKSCTYLSHLFSTGITPGIGVGALPPRSRS